MNNHKKTASILRAQGISCVPTNGKVSTVPWKGFMDTLPTEDNIDQWWKNGENIAAVGRNIQCMDFDDPSVFPQFIERCREAGLDFTLDRLVMQETPSGGMHLVWLCDDTDFGNMKLANTPDNKPRIETRGYGGYFLICPSEGYVLFYGNWDAIETITPEERENLLEVARSFNQKHKPEKTPSPSTGSGESPGDDYDARGDVYGLLRSHGWTQVGENHWRRPGRAQGISASFGHVEDRFWVFSTSTQFDTEHLYRPWHVYAILEHGGDYKAAAGALRAQGFGKSNPESTRDRWNDGHIPAPWTGTEVPYSGEPPLEPPADKEASFMDLIFSRLWNPENRPPPMRKIYKLGGIVICTPGNLTAITAQAKTGKSAFCGAVLASTMVVPGSEESDTLGVEGYNDYGKVVLYIDSEQSPEDSWYGSYRALLRAKVAEPPDWLYCFCLAGLTSSECKKSVPMLMKKLGERHGGIHSVIIDGVADLVQDVNDAKECNSLVSGLQGLAIDYDCPILGVIHMNPKSGKGANDKVRGHLGSQLERKAETNLHLEKSGEITIIWSEKQRRAPILKDTGPRFKWDDNLKMHVSASGEKAPPTQLIQSLYYVAEEVFSIKAGYQHGELVTALSKARDKAVSTTTVWVQKMRAEGIVKVEGTVYLKNF